MNPMPWQQAEAPVYSVNISQKAGKEQPTWTTKALNTSNTSWDRSHGV